MNMAELTTPVVSGKRATLRSAGRTPESASIPNSPVTCRRTPACCRSGTVRVAWASEARRAQLRGASKATPPIAPGVFTARTRARLRDTNTQTSFTVKERR